MMCVCASVCVCVRVCLFFSPKKCLRPALKLEQKLFWASLDYWLFGRRVLHWQNQFLLLFKIYWNLTHRSNAAVSVAVAAGDDVNCAALLLLYAVSSSLPQFINGSHFSRSVKQSVVRVFVLQWFSGSRSWPKVSFCAPITQTLSQLERKVFCHNRNFALVGVIKHLCKCLPWMSLLSNIN